MTTSTPARRPRAARAASTARPPEPRRRRWPVLVTALLLALLLAAAGYVLFFSSLLGFRTVTVSGANGALAAQVEAAVDVPTGTPLIRVDPAAQADRIRAVPAVDTVEVARAWPHGLSVVITPRVPVAVTRANGGLWLLDAHGLPYEQVPAVPPAAAGSPALPTIELATPGAGDPATLAALHTVAALPPVVQARLARVRAPSPFDITLVMTDGREVFWGPAEDLAGKAAVLPAVLTRPGRHFDISDPTLISVR